MSRALVLVIVIMSVVVGVSAQTTSRGEQRKNHVEDKRVSVRVDKVPAAEVENNFVPHTGYKYSGDDFKPGVVQVGPRTTYLKEGLTTQEVVRLLGNPISVSERTEKNLVVTTYQFQRGEGRTLIAEFEQGLLVRSRIEEHVGQFAQADN